MIGAHYKDIIKKFSTGAGIWCTGQSDQTSLEI